jgi:hypothetical protein
MNALAAGVDQSAQSQAVMLFERAEYCHDFVRFEFVGLDDHIFALGYTVVAAAF